MKYAHSVEVSVFCKPEHDKPKITEKLKSLFPFDIEDEKLREKKHLDFAQKAVKGFGDTEIQILKVRLMKDNVITQFLTNLFSKLKDQKDLINTQLESRIDEHGNFFLRLDLAQLLDDTFKITDNGDCIHIRVNLATFPKTREKALAMVRELLAL